MRSTIVAFGLLLLTACAQAEPDGLYLMTRMNYGSSLETTAYRFEDGSVVRNPVSPELQDPANIGSYAVDGDTMSMTFGDDTSSSEVEAGDNGCFFWDMGNFCPVGEFEDDRLEGTYSGGASAGFGAVSNAMTVTFTPDGSYTLSSTGAVVTSEGTAGSTTEERGTYQLDGSVLTLAPEGGQPRQLTTFPYDDGSQGPQPRRLFFGGGMLKRQN